MLEEWAVVDGRIAGGGLSIRHLFQDALIRCFLRKLLPVCGRTMCLCQLQPSYFLSWDNTLLRQCW
jgi:hypothetical protein